MTDLNKYLNEMKEVEGSSLMLVTTSYKNWNKLISISRVLLDAVEFYEKKEHWDGGNVDVGKRANYAIEKCREIVNGLK